MSDDINVRNTNAYIVWLVFCGVTLSASWVFFFGKIALLFAERMLSLSFSSYLWGVCSTQSITLQLPLFIFVKLIRPLTRDLFIDGGLGVTTVAGSYCWPSYTSAQGGTLPPHSMHLARDYSKINSKWCHVYIISWSETYKLCTFRKVMAGIVDQDVVNVTLWPT